MYNFNLAIARAEEILLEKGFGPPTEDMENFKEFETYQPVVVRPGFTTKKIERVNECGEKCVFMISVKKLDDKAFIEIWERISNTLL